MKITLISPYPDVTSFGLRTISACLKQSGHKARMIFLPDPHGDNIISGAKRYDDGVLDGIIDLCDDSDIIGITLMTDFFEGAIQITEKIKSKLDKPILWGGVHPTIRPEESLEYADIVCIGEGEESCCELLDKMQRGEVYDNTRNFWFRKNGTILKNPLRPLTKSLDIYPMPDYNFSDHYLMFENRIQVMTPELFKLALTLSPVATFIFHRLGYAYQTMTSRGCPHKCTYCLNDTIKNLYGGSRYLRWRSTDHVIKELLWVKQEIPYVGHMRFSDDSFFARSEEKIREFCVQYKEKIGLPFFALVSPLTITDKKMSLLIDAGLICVQMGIETGSRKMQELFNRKPMTNERTLKATKIINKYKDKMFPPLYDFIVDSPYETVKDTIESLRFISLIPKPFRLQIFSMVMYPQTQLYEMAKQDGLIKNEREEVYNKGYTKIQQGYFNFLFSLAKRGGIPGWLLRFLVSTPVVCVLNSNILRPIVKYLEIIARSIFRLLKSFLNMGKKKPKTSLHQ